MAGEVDVYTQSIGGVKVDEGLFRRGQELSYGGTLVFVASMEDLIGLKVTAGRELDLADMAVLFHERGQDIDVGRLEELVGIESLRRAAPVIADLLPEEYGWQARQRLKAWLRERGWLIAARKSAAGSRRR